MKLIIHITGGSGMTIEKAIKGNDPSAHDIVLEIKILMRDGIFHEKAYYPPSRVSFIEMEDE